MEGIMTGIKPRESFNEKGMSDTMRSDIENIQGRINLIDAISGAGASPLGNPLTQFLLQTGQNLIGGTAAGGTKLQEIVGATRDPLNKAIAAQERRNASRRKIAATLLSKMGTGGLQKYVQQAKDAFKFDTTGELAKRYNNNPQRYALELFNQDRFRQGKSSATILRETLDNEAEGIMKRERNFRTTQSYFIPSAARDIAQAKDALVKNKTFQEGKFTIDNNLYYLPPESDYNPGEKKGTLVPEDADRLSINNLYYNYNDKTWYLYDGVTLTPKFKTKR